MSEDSGRVTRRKNADVQYTMISNLFLREKDLSFGARGLLAYMLSHADNWKIYKSNLHLNTKNGRDAVAAMFKELVEAGYIEVLKSRDPVTNRFNYSYTVDDVPIAVYGNPYTEKRPTETRTHKNTIIEKTEIENNKQEDLTRLDQKPSAFVPSFSSIEEEFSQAAIQALSITENNHRAIRYIAVCTLSHTESGTLPEALKQLKACLEYKKRTREKMFSNHSALMKAVTDTDWVTKLSNYKRDNLSEGISNAESLLDKQPVDVAGRHYQDLLRNKLGK